MGTAIYLRISDDREGRELGVDRQREDCMTLAKRLGAEDPMVYSDNDKGASTRSRKRRPDYHRLMDDARAGQVRTIIAYTSGRLTRRPREHEDLIELAERHGVTFRYVASPDFDLNTSAGRRIARILAANDAGEAEDIAERVQREVRQRAEQGRHHGGPRAYGYTVDGMSKVDDEAANLQRWYSELLAGRTISAISREAGRHHASMLVIFKNPRNAGLRVLDGIEYRGGWPAVVSVETWRAAVRLLTDPNRRTNTKNVARRWLGTGLYGCERCGGKPVIATGAGAKNGGHSQYLCPPKRGGCSRNWHAAKLDAWIVELVAERLSRDDIADLLPRQRPDLEALRTEGMAIRANMKELTVSFATAKGATLAAITEGLGAAEVRLAEIEAALTDAGRSGPLGPILTAADPVEAWLAIPADHVDRRQAVVRALMTVTLGPSPRGRAHWDGADFVRIDWRTS